MWRAAAVSYPVTSYRQTFLSMTYYNKVYRSFLSGTTSHMGDEFFNCTNEVEMLKAVLKAKPHLQGLYIQVNLPS